MGDRTLLLDNLGPSFGVLREEMRKAAAHVSVEDARAAIADHGLFKGAPTRRAQVLALLEGGLGFEERRRCDELLQQAVESSNYLSRPGTVEELWYLEALLDKCMR